MNDLGSRIRIGMDAVQGAPERSGQSRDGAPVALLPRPRYVRALHAAPFRGGAGTETVHHTL